jgi:hypothetical protein
MAIVQISRIQHRRGLQQDLPNLASAELGWSLDERRLYIGNGTLEFAIIPDGLQNIEIQDVVLNDYSVCVLSNDKKMYAFGMSNTVVTYYHDTTIATVPEKLRNRPIKKLVSNQGSIYTITDDTCEIYVTSGINTPNPLNAIIYTQIRNFSSD